jgi:chromosome segregation ATPase
VENYRRCVTAVEGLGEIRSISSDLEDVSEEFYDLQARIRNKQEEEERLRRHLADSTAKLEDILAVEREIARVREEIERMEGRIRVLRDLTSLTTITVRVEEIRDYVPEQAPTYATRVRRAFSGSVASLVSTAEWVSIAAVALAPWLPVIVVGLLLGIGGLKLGWRLLFRRRT